MTVQIKTKLGSIIEIEDARFGEQLDFGFMVMKVRCDGYLCLQDFFIDYENIELIALVATPTMRPPMPTAKEGMN